MQDQQRALDAANAENPFSHKNRAGEWVEKPKPKNVVTLTIERYAREHKMTMED